MHIQWETQFLPWEMQSSVLQGSSLWQFYTAAFLVYPPMWSHVACTRRKVFSAKESLLFFLNPFLLAPTLQLLARFLRLVHCPCPLFWSFISTKDILHFSGSRWSWTGIACDEHAAAACFCLLLAATCKGGLCSAVSPCARSSTPSASRALSEIGNFSLFHFLVPFPGALW